VTLQKTPAADGGRYTAWDHLDWAEKQLGAGRGHPTVGGTAEGGN
jgi:hypothetical protein